MNNWDLVDSSASYILGDYFRTRDTSLLYTFARSPNLWERRIAIITTEGFIKYHEFDDTLNISEILLHDRHDLIHKTVGWMLREVGKHRKTIPGYPRGTHAANHASVCDRKISRG